MTRTVNAKKKGGRLKLDSETATELETPEVVASEGVFDGKMIGVRVDTLRFEDGRTHRREIVEYGQAVVLVPVADDGRLLLVRQYRHPARAWLL